MILLLLVLLLLLSLTLINSCKNENKIEVYLCHHDDCAGKIDEEIRKANENVYFMSYTFTNTRIGNDLILKSKAAASNTLLEM